VNEQRKNITRKYLAVWVVWTDGWVNSSWPSVALVKDVSGWSSIAIDVAEWVVWTSGWRNSSWVSLLSKSDSEKGQGLDRTKEGKVYLD